jgi:uncharacterized membrane protein
MLGRRTTFSLVVVLAGAYAAWLALLAMAQRRTMFHFDDDLANYDQAIWNTTQGRPFASTLIEHADNWFGDHFAPVVALFVPLYMIWPTPSWLLIA